MEPRYRGPSSASPAPQSPVRLTPRKRREAAIRGGFPIAIVLLIIALCVLYLSNVVQRAKEASGLTWFDIIDAFHVEPRHPSARASRKKWREALPLIEAKVSHPEQFFAVIILGLLVLLGSVLLEGLTDTVRGHQQRNLDGVA